MKAMKLAAAFSDKAAAEDFAASNSGVLFSSNRETTSHLPFAALFVGVTDDLAAASAAADVGVYLVCERTIRNKSLDDLEDDELPGVAGLFVMVANPALGPAASDAHWRDNHAPLALEIHEIIE